MQGESECKADTNKSNYSQAVQCTQVSQAHLRRLCYHLIVAHRLPPGMQQGFFYWQFLIISGAATSFHDISLLNIVLYSEQACRLQASKRAYTNEEAKSFNFCSVMPSPRKYRDISNVSVVWRKTVWSRSVHVRLCTTHNLCVVHKRTGCWSIKTCNNYQFIEAIRSAMSQSYYHQ